MDTRKVTLIATIAAIALLAVGIGYAYTASTINSQNTANNEYITLTQGDTGAYTFTNTTTVKWNSVDWKEGASDFRTKFTLAANTETLGDYTVVQVGNPIQLNASYTGGTIPDSVVCQIGTDFTMDAAGMQYFLKITGATASDQLYRLASDGTFIKIDGSGGNVFTIDKKDTTTFKPATVKVYVGYATTPGYVETTRSTASAPVVAPAQKVLDSKELSFTIHAAGANSPGSTPVSSITMDATKAVTIGTPVTLTPTVTGTVQTVTWSSSNTAIATVDDGTVSGVSAGIAVITATTDEGKLIATCVVTVSPSA